MPDISKRGTLMPSSPIRKLVPFSESAKRRGVKVHHLNIGQPDIPTPQVALDAVRNIKDKIFEYTHSAGIESYRNKLVHYYKQVDIDVNIDQMIVTVGGSEAIFMAMTVAMDPGDEIIIPEPFYANYNAFATESGVIIKPIFSTIENDFALPPIAEFEKHITPATKAIMICNPNNPTGYLYSKAELEQLSEIVKRYNLFLFSDEVYREFCYDGHEHFSALNLKGLENNVVMIDSVSKRYSMCGVRVGTLVSRNEKIIAGAMKIAQARLCSPYIGQVAASAAIDTPKSYFEAVHKEYMARRDTLVEGLNRIEGVYCPTPRGSFYVTVRLPIDNCDKFAQWLLEEFSYNGETVMVAPASGFYASRALGHNEVRIAYVLKREELLAALKCLEEALKIYPGRVDKL